MPQSKKRQATNNPDLERVANDIRGNRQAGQRQNPFSRGTPEAEALEAVNQMINGIPAGQRRAGQRQNPFPPGTIEGNALNSVDQSVRGVSGNSYQDFLDRHPYNPNAAQEQIFNDIQGPRNPITLPQPLDTWPTRTAPVQTGRRLGDLQMLPGNNFGLNQGQGQSVDDQVRGMSLENKLVAAMRLSATNGQLSKKTQEELGKILSPNNLPGLTLLLGVWGAGHLFGAGQVVDSFMLGFMVGSLGVRGVEALGKLWSFFSGAQNATTQAELNLASEDFASFVSIVTTEGLTAFVGAKGAEAVKGLRSHVHIAFPNFKSLIPEQQKAVLEALETSRKAAETIGKRVEGRFSQVAAEAGNWLDNALGKRRPATANGSTGNSGGGDRQPENRGRGSNKPELSQAEKFERLKTEMHLTDDVIKAFIGNKIAAETVYTLNGKGLTPRDLNEFLAPFAQTRDGYKIESLAQVADSLVALTNRGLNIKDAQAILQKSREFKQILDVVQKIALSKGKLENPSSLKQIVEESFLAFRAGRTNTSEISRLDYGKVRELQIAAERLSQGHHVQLGAVYNPTYKKNVGADVVDFTTNEYIQVKTISSFNKNALESNIEKAIKQLQEETGEYVPKNGILVAEIRPDIRNGFSDGTRKTINTTIQEMIERRVIKSDFKGFVKIVVENVQGQASQTMKFYIENGRSRIISSIGKEDYLAMGHQTRSLLDDSRINHGNEIPNQNIRLINTENNDLDVALVKSKNLLDEWRGYNESFISSSAVEKTKENFARQSEESNHNRRSQQREM
jgi:hypothetical protein